MIAKTEPWALNVTDEILINLALKEDLGFPFFDATCEYLFADNYIQSQAAIISKHATPITLCGIPVLRALLGKIDQSSECVADCSDGSVIMPGQPILTLRGNAKALLMLERTALNFLRHLSAIATLTACFVEKIQGSKTKILDTRKTTPGFRHLEKYAVACGGGVNHRQGLYDAIMIKDTHVDLLGGMSLALAQLPPRAQNKLPVIVEVRNRAELEIVLREAPDRVDRVLLDNMTLPELAASVALCQGIVDTEASGNITLETISSIAQTQVDFASVGMLTHSAGQVDLSMKGL